MSITYVDVQKINLQWQGQKGQLIDVSFGRKICISDYILPYKSIRKLDLCRYHNQKVQAFQRDYLYNLFIYSIIYIIYLSIYIRVISCCATVEAQQSRSPLT